MITPDTEYTMLRQEILDLINIQNNYIIAMYTITITILGIALERQSQVLFLVPYLILFSFQRIISAKKDGMVRIAAYISVYLEKDKEGWESKYEELVAATCEKKTKQKKFFKIIEHSNWQDIIFTTGGSL